MTTKPVITTFSALAPLIIQQYERYLPTAFDESMSLVQRVNKIIQRLDEMGLLVNDVVEQWNVVNEWVMNDGLDESVIAKLDLMATNGTLASLINDVLFDDIKKRISDITISVKDYLAVGDGIADDQAELVQAVRFAYDNGLDLHFPKGTYLSTGNIDYFHDVNKTGDGVIKRGTDLFKITPNVGDTNIIYTGYGGTAMNDGITNSQPRQLAYVRNTLQNLGEKASKGQWRVQFTMGTILDTGLVWDNMPYFAKPLQIWGVYDGTSHLSIWDGTNSTAVYAIRADGNNAHLNMEFKDFKFQNWQGHVSNAGAIVAWQGVNIRTENVHCLNCTIGFWGRGGYSTHYGDIMDNCVWGYGFQYSHTATIGSSIFPRIKIRNCDKGVFVGRTTVIHADYTDFTDNIVDIQVHQKSRVACVQSTFARWSDVSYWLQGDSIFENDGSTWDAVSITDATPIDRLDNGSSIPAVHIGPTPYRVAHYVPDTGYTITGALADVLLSSQIGFGSPLRIPKNLLYNKATIQIIVKCRIDIGGTVGAKTVKLAGANATTQVLADITIPASATGGGLGEVTFELSLRANGTGIYKAQYSCSNANLATVKHASISSTTMDAVRDKTEDLTLWRLYGSVDGAGDTMSIYSLTTTLIG